MPVFLLRLFFCGGAGFFVFVWRACSIAVMAHAGCLPRGSQFKCRGDGGTMLPPLWDAQLVSEACYTGEGPRTIRGMACVQRIPSCACPKDNAELRAVKQKESTVAVVGRAPYYNGETCLGRIMRTAHISFFSVLFWLLSFSLPVFFSLGSFTLEAV